MVEVSAARLPAGLETSAQAYWMAPKEMVPQELPAGSAACAVSITLAPVWIAEVTPSGSNTTAAVTGVPAHTSGEVTHLETARFWNATGEESPSGFFTERLTA